MQQFNSWKVGGASDCFYTPADIVDLSYFLGHCVGDEPITFLGLGSNVLVRDAGVQGVVIAMRGVLTEIKQLDQTTVRVEAGVTCARLARYCCRQKLSGVEFFAGVPGTVGGALAMNAGAFGSETWEKVIAVETINRCGELNRREPKEFEIAYRHILTPHEEWFIAGEFKLSSQDSDQSDKKMRAMLRQKKCFSANW